MKVVEDRGGCGERDPPRKSGSRVLGKPRNGPEVKNGSFMFYPCLSRVSFDIAMVWGPFSPGV